MAEIELNVNTLGVLKISIFYVVNCQHGKQNAIMMKQRSSGIFKQGMPEKSLYHYILYT